jgi:molybdopterin/thiamine biosynthesis adenylyltransferase
MVLQENKIPQVYLDPKWLRGESTFIHGFLNGYSEEQVFHFHSGIPLVNYGDVLVDCILSITNTIEAYNYALDKGNEFFESYVKSEKELKCKTYFLCINSNNIDQGGTLFLPNETITCKIGLFPNPEKLFSRHKGLLAYETLISKKVAIVGMGSFGSHLAVELAKAGVLHFTLIDNDRLESENIVRHACGQRDLGRFKTKAVKDVLNDKNSRVSIETFEGTLEQYIEHYKDGLSNFDLILGCTDNNSSRFLLSHIALTHNIPLLIGKAFSAAEGGDVFVQKSQDEACYACHLDFSNPEHNQEISSETQRQKQAPTYGITATMPATIQIGLSSDLNPIINQMVKLALLQLSQYDSDTYPMLMNELSHNYFIWANRRENYFANWQPFHNSKNQPTILRWYGAKIHKNKDCVCNSCL